MKIAKMLYFSIFFKKSKHPCVKYFEPLDEKRKLLGNFEKIFQNFS